MIFTDLIYIFTGIGIIVGTVGAGFLLIFGACILYELLGDNYNDIRRKVSWNKWRKTDEQLSILHLNHLSKKYPDLEITYKKK